MLIRSRPAILFHAAAERLIGQDAIERLGHLADVPRRYQQTRYAILNRLYRSASGAGYDGAATRHGLEIHVGGSPFVGCRRAKHVRALEELWHSLSVDKSAELDRALCVLGVDAGLQFSNKFTVASSNNLQLDIGML